MRNGKTLIELLIEAKTNMSADAYFRAATAEGLSTRKIGGPIGISHMGVVNQLKSRGYEYVDGKWVQSSACQATA